MTFMDRHHRLDHDRDPPFPTAPATPTRSTMDIIDALYNTTTKTYTKYNTVGNLPAHNYFNFGLSYAFPGQGITLSANLDNAFQSKGLGEGNPRLLSSGGNQVFLARPILPRRLTAFIAYQF